MCCQVFQTILLCLIKAWSWLIQNYFSDKFWENCFWDYFSGATGHHDHSISALGREAGTGGSVRSLPTHIILWFFFPVLWEQTPCQRCETIPGLVVHHQFWSQATVMLLRVSLSASHLGLPPCIPLIPTAVMGADGLQVGLASLLSSFSFRKDITSPFCRHFINTV